jgi:hypothetical protein
VDLGPEAEYYYFESKIIFMGMYGIAENAEIAQNRIAIRGTLSSG